MSILKLYAMVVSLCLLTACGDGSKDVAESGQAGPQVGVLNTDYRVKNDDYTGGLKRTVDVELPERVSAKQLEALAEKIKAAQTHKTDRTFISYTLEGHPSMSWATTHYNPDLEVSVLGLSNEDYQQLLSKSLSVEYPQLVGAWIGERSFNALYVVYVNDGAVHQDLVFPNGEKLSYPMRVVKEVDGMFRLEDIDGDEPEFLRLGPSGALQFWNENRNFTTLLPRDPAEINLALFN